MKLLFSLLFLYLNTGYSQVINIYHHQDDKNAEIIRNIFIEKYQLPNSLIMVHGHGCRVSVDHRYLNLCITKKGELIMLPSDIDFLRKSLTKFVIR